VASGWLWVGQRGVGQVVLAVLAVHPCGCRGNFAEAAEQHIIMKIIIKRLLDVGFWGSPRIIFGLQQGC